DSQSERKNFDSAPAILIYDQCPAHHAVIAKIVSSTGARPIELTNLRPPQCSPRCCISVVGMGTEIEGEELRIIRELKLTGFRIIACGDEVESWSVKVRCLPLVAGAGRLLDKTAPDFTDCLRAALEQTLAIEAKNQREAQQIKSAMRAMGMVGQSAAMMRVFRRVVSFSKLSD